jgi:hypothetical protein
MCQIGCLWIMEGGSTDGCLLDYNLGKGRDIYIVYWSIPDNPIPILCYVLNHMQSTMSSNVSGATCVIEK